MGMIDVLYWLQGSWKTIHWRKLSSKNNKRFVDLDIFIVNCYFKENSIKAFIKSHNDEEEWWKNFRNIEHKALKLVLEQWYDCISLGGWTMEFKRNRDLLSEYEVLKIYLETDVKNQVERLTSENASWNNNRVLPPKDELEKDLTKVYNRRHKIYTSNADGVVVTNNKEEDIVFQEIENKLSFLEKIIPIRNNIDEIDNAFINCEIDKGFSLAEWFEKDVFWEDTSEECKVMIWVYLRKMNEEIEGTLWRSLTVFEVRLLTNRLIQVAKVAELKKEYNQTALQKWRKQEVENRWEQWLQEKWVEIYDIIHRLSVEMEKEIMNQE